MTDEERNESQDEVQVSEAAEAEVAVDNESPAGEEGGGQPVDSSEGGEAGTEGDALAEGEAPPEEDSPGEDFKVVNKDDASEDDAEAAMLAMLEDLPQDDGGAAPEDINFKSAEVANAEFQHLSEPAAKPDAQNIDLLMDVNLPIAIELGRTKMSVADILGLGPGSVVELNKLAGEPVDVMVNHKIVAKGEVVVIDENFGVRITQLMTPEQRLRLLSDEQ